MKILVIGLLLFSGWLIYSNVEAGREQAELSQLRQDVDALSVQVNGLRQDLHKYTHPASIQQRTIEYILRQGEFTEEAEK